jgi:tetratricopeptide (TPR) repeat protein
MFKDLLHVPAIPVPGMGFFTFRERTSQKEERNQDEDDADFHAIFEIEDLDSLGIEDTGDTFQEKMEGNKSPDQQSRIPPERGSGTPADGISEDGLYKKDTGNNETIKQPGLNLMNGSESAIVWNNKGVTLSRIRRYTEAMKAFDQALRIDPLYTRAWNNRGVTLSRLGRYAEAIEAYDRALQVNPGYQDPDPTLELEETGVSILKC